MRTTLSAAVAALVVAGCTEGGASRGSAVIVTIDSVGKTIFVRNRGIPPEWTLRESAVIGSIALDSAGPDAFTRITGVLGDADNNVFVADARSRDIRRFDERGAFVRRIGREGAGPGEFGNLQSIGWLGDTLAALDAGNARIGLLTREGEWLGQRTHIRLTGSGLYLHQTTPTEFYSFGLRRTTSGSTRVFARHTFAGVVDTIAAPQDPERRRPALECSHQQGGGISFYTVDLAPRLLRLPAPNQQRIDIWSSEYKLVFLNSAGDTARVIERDIPPGPLTDEEWSAEERAWKSWKDALPPSTCNPASLPRPETRDLIRGVYFDDESRLWVERRIAAGSAFDVFDAEGRLVGSVGVPKRIEDVPPYIRRNRLHLVTADSLDVQQVRVYEVVQR